MRLLFQRSASSARPHAPARVGAERARVVPQARLRRDGAGGRVPDAGASRGFLPGGTAHDRPRLPPPPRRPPAVAPFSHAVESDGWVILTGQMPTDPAAPDAPLPDGIEAQTVRVMKNLHLVLRELGLGLDHILQCRCFLTHFDRDYAAFNATYRRSPETACRRAPRWVSPRWSLARWSRSMPSRGGPESDMMRLRITPRPCCKRHFSS